ncbi:ER membrane protein complex subunit 4 [Glycine max]|nr:ER membrane protein complex subunit 4 [Glycine max]
MEKGKGVMGSGGRRWGDDSTLSRQKKDAESNWKAQKAWEVAQAPMKNLLMMGFMMWMAGSTVHLFSIGITFSALWQPISALQSVGKMFEPYKDNKVELLGPKLLFIALNLGGLALAQCIGASSYTHIRLGLILGTCSGGGVFRWRCKFGLICEFFSCPACLGGNLSKQGLGFRLGG